MRSQLKRVHPDFVNALEHQRKLLEEKYRQMDIRVSDTVASKEMANVYWESLVRKNGRKK